MRATTVVIPTRVLVFGMARPDDSIDAGDLYDVAEACHQTPEQVRSCLRRLVGEGLLERDGSGRNATYRITSEGDQLRLGSRRRHELAYRQDHQAARGQAWDGNWHLAAFAIPEDQRSSRDRLRDRLLDTGGAAINNGLYVSPHPWEDDVRSIARDLSVLDRLSLASTTDLEIGGERSPAQLARTLWPVDKIAAAYTLFLDDHQAIIPSLERLQERNDRITDTDFLPGSLGMVIAFQQVFLRDPLLPPELLPHPWPGRAARDLLATSRRLALALREDHERPALFASYDRLVTER
ncbi:MAG: PaaX family transcriptional regulator C-terminal domain-containing protein [Aquihabitans sp.]